MSANLVGNIKGGSTNLETKHRTLPFSPVANDVESALKWFLVIQQACLQTTNTEILK